MTALRITFGIDPGASGAIAVLADGEPINALDMPTTAKKSGGNEVNADAIADFLRDIARQHHGATFNAAIERVGANRVGGRQQGSATMFAFGVSFGIVVGVLGALRVSMTKVEPVAWKRHFGLLKTDKDVARGLAIQKFPDIAHMLTRKKDGGRADAMLIGKFFEHREGFR